MKRWIWILALGVATAGRADAAAWQVAADTLQVQGSSGSDTNTGIIRSGEDSLGFMTGGTRRLMLDGSGNAIGRLTWSNGASFADSVLITSGNLRGGTSNWYHKGTSLALGGTNPDLAGHGTSITALAIISPSGDNRANLHLKNTAPAVNGVIGDIDFWSGSNNVARINVFRANDAGSNGAFMRFGTAAGGSLNWAVVIDSTRNVGIGTSIKLGGKFDVNAGEGGAWTRIVSPGDAVTTSSDSTMKQDYAWLNPQGLKLLSVFRSIQVVNYRWKPWANPDRALKVGMRAQDFWPIARLLRPGASKVSLDTNDMQMATFLMIQELDADAIGIRGLYTAQGGRLTSLEARVAALEGK